MLPSHIDQNNEFMQSFITSPTSLMPARECAQSSIIKQTANKRSLFQKRKASQRIFYFLKLMTKRAGIVVLV